MLPDLLDFGRLPHLAVLVVWALPVAGLFDMGGCVSRTMRRVRNAVSTRRLTGPRGVQR